ncbi:hypothetical protein JGD26_23820 [Salmonella enterica subsp. enterica serovar Derby]|nr:hypothetical protein [Salmonella enterica subsp. enterica serovar Derby]
MISLAGKKMKTNYFTHRLFPSDGAVICEPLKTSFDNMIATNRNTATLANEYHVIQHVSGDVYTFIKTNSRDVFRKLDTRSNICVDLGGRRIIKKRQLPGGGDIRQRL